jgi:hypothetical protein
VTDVTCDRIHLETPPLIHRLPGETDPEFIERANSELSMDHILAPTADVNILTGVVPIGPPEKYRWHEFKIGDYRLFYGDDLDILRHRLAASVSAYGKRNNVTFRVTLSREHNVVAVQRVIRLESERGRTETELTIADMAVGETINVEYANGKNVGAVAGQWKRKTETFRDKKFKVHIDFKSRQLLITRTS